MSRTVFRAWWWCALPVIALGIGFTPRALAEVRTGSTTVKYPGRTSKSFPGLRTLSLRYDDATGALKVTARLRAVLADPSDTSALRSTELSVHLGDFYGDDLFANDCDWSSGSSVNAVLRLGSLTATLDPNTPFDATDDIATPVVVSPDRLTVTAAFPANPRTRRRNLICVAAELVGPGIIGDDAPADYTEDRLLDGFSGADGNIGEHAADGILDQFRYLYNGLVRKRDAVGRVAGARATCTPRAGVIYVKCRARARIRPLANARIVVRGSRIYQLAHMRDMFNRRGKVLRWQQTMRVAVRWRHCPSTLARTEGPKACSLRTVWRTGERLDDTIYAALKRRMASPQ